jgi:hypothetical protein
MRSPLISSPTRTFSSPWRSSESETEKMKNRLVALMYEALLSGSKRTAFTHLSGLFGKSGRVSRGPSLSQPDTAKSGKATHSKQREVLSCILLTSKVWANLASRRDDTLNGAGGAQLIEISRCSEPAHRYRSGRAGLPEKPPQRNRRKLRDRDSGVVTLPQAVAALRFSG